MVLFWIAFTILMAGGLIYSLRMQKKIKAKLKDEAKDNASGNNE